MQTHVLLLQAPRGFSHPAWLPRQNVCTTLDNTLQDFLIDSGLGHAGSAGDSGNVRRHQNGGSSRLVTCQNSSSSDNDDGTSHPVAATVPTISTAEAREEDELDLVSMGWQTDRVCGVVTLIFYFLMKRQ
jgi:hypothetical protein